MFIIKQGDHFSNSRHHIPILELGAGNKLVALKALVI